MSFPKASGNIYLDFKSCCSRDFLESIPDEARELLETGELRQFIARFPEQRSGFAAEIRALGGVVKWILENQEEERRRKRRGRR
jgi:hypothetical protein